MFWVLVSCSIDDFGFPFSCFSVILRFIKVMLRRDKNFHEKIYINVCANLMDGKQLSETKLIMKIVLVCFPGHITSLVVFRVISNPRTS